MAEQTNWNGSVWGDTTKGTVIAEFSREGNRLEGKILLFEPGLGQLQAKLSGGWSDENEIDAALQEFTGNYNVPVTLPKGGRIWGRFDSGEGVLAGEWETDTPSSGKFLMVKIDAAQMPIPTLTNPLQGPHIAGGPQSNIPPLVTKTVVLSSYRFDEKAVRRLAELVTSGTTVRTPAINASHDGSEHIHIGVDNLLADPAVPNVVYDMIVAANEPTQNIGSKTVTLTFKKNDRNSLYISGFDQVWVEGKAAQIQTFLKEHESKSAFLARNYGGNINSVLFLAMLGFLPSIPSLKHRLLVVVFVFALLLLLLYSWRLAASTKVFLREAKVVWYERNAGWLLVILEVVLTAWVALLIHRFIPGQ